MRVVVRTRSNPNPTQKYDGKDAGAVKKAVTRGGIITNLSPVPTIPNIDAAILAAVQVEGCKLEMRNWHNGFDSWARDGKPAPLCGTTNCRAGWAIHLCGSKGYNLEKKYADCSLGYESGAHIAGTLIYAASDPEAIVPDFFPGDIEARDEFYDDDGNEKFDSVEGFVVDDLRERAARQLAASKGEGDE